MEWIHQLYPSSVVTSTSPSLNSSSSTLTQLQQQNSVEPLSSMWNRLPESIKSSFEHELHQLASHREFILGQYYHHLIDSIPHGLDPTMMMTAAELESLNSIEKEYVNQWTHEKDGASVGCKLIEAITSAFAGFGSELSN